MKGKRLYKQPTNKAKYPQEMLTFTGNLGGLFSTIIAESWNCNNIDQ